MPTYDYYCKKCLHDFEKFLPIAKMDDPLNEPCPKCGEVGCIEKIMGAPVVHWTFMGSTIQSHAPEGFKDILRNMKKNNGGKTPGIEL
jgi:putative FmdB family regulatory protein